MAENNEEGEEKLHLTGKNSHFCSLVVQFIRNKLQKLEDALRETGETGDIGGKWDTVLRHDINLKLGEISNS